MPRRTANSYRVRRGTVRDLDVLVRHRRGMWRDISDHTAKELDAADPVYRRWARQRLRSGSLVAFVAETPGGEAVASGAVWLRENQPRPGWDNRAVPYLLSMYTEPEHRGKGLATKIVEAALRWARGQGFRRMTLHAAVQGRGIYGKRGFERTWEMRARITRRSARGRATPRGPRRSSAASRRRGAPGIRGRR